MICKINDCEGLVKPDIVFFGEALPLEFHKKAPFVEQADLVFVMGTSLKVNLKIFNLNFNENKFKRFSLLQLWFRWLMRKCLLC